MSKSETHKCYFTAQLSLEEKYGKRSVVLMQFGGFYEMYGLDTDKKIGQLEDVHSILGMTITRKNKSLPHSEGNPYLMGFPCCAVDEHLATLLRANFTVAKYDQRDVCVKIAGETRTRKERILTKIYTPSTFIDDAAVDTHGLLVFCLGEYKSVDTRQTFRKVHVAILSVSTGETLLFEAYDSHDDVGRAGAELYRLIHTYNPSEIIFCGKEDISKTLDVGTKKVYFRSVPKEYFNPVYQNEFLKKIFTNAPISPIEYLGLSMHSSVIPYLLQALQFAFEQDKFIVSRIKKPIFIENKDQLILNNDSIYQLNLISPPFDQTVSLFDIVCSAKTAMGKRMVKQRLLCPLTNIEKINKRYDRVEKMKSCYKE